MSGTSSMHEFVVAALNALTLDELEVVANDTKISKWTLQKIRTRAIENPGVKGIETLHQYLRTRAKRRNGQRREARAS